MSNTNSGISSERSKFNRDKCCVDGCKSRADKDLTVHFHRFPKQGECFVYKENMFGKLEKIDKLKAWLNAVKKREAISSIKVCSLHFEKQDYILPDVPSQRRRLKKQAIPSLNLLSINAIQSNVKLNKARQQRRLKRTEQRMKIEKCEAEDNLTNNVEEMAIVEHENQIIEVECTPAASFNENCEPHTENEFFTNSSPEATIPLVQDVSVQVNSSDVNPNFLQFIKSDNDLSTMTGIESFSILNTILEIIKVVHNDKFEKTIVKMNTKNRVIMTYMKLKQNLSYRFLSIIFYCYTAKHCQRVFEDTVKILSQCLKPAIPWPLKEEISRNLPQCFKGFENVRIILDCTEIFIQKPTNLCCQILTYSHYKGSQTAKIMTGVSPAGNITYISKVYGGRVSDTAIFEQSDLVKLLEPGDDVMVDRGFLIDKTCEQNRWKCIRPPFLKDRKQFTMEESVLTSKIASARVHIERSNQRIKNFKIVGTTMPSNLVPLLEDIFIVICGTINMSSPIIKDDKFMKI